MKTNHYICYALAALSSISTPLAYSQIEEVLVTAQKREESIQSIGISVQAYSQDEIQKRGIGQAGEILDQFANVSRNSANRINAGYTIRGVGTNNFHGNVNRAVAVYQDDVFLSNPYSGAMSVFDLARIELLRGPQNTLLGRNSIGGAVNYIANTPEIGAGTHGYFILSGGENNFLKIESAVGMDNGKNFASRFSISSARRDGVFENQAPGREGEALGETELDAARLQLLFQPTEKASFNFKLHYGENGGKGTGNKGLGIRDPDNPTLACDPQLIEDNIDFESRIDCVTANGVNPSSDNWNDIYEVGPAKQDVKFTGATIRFDYQFNTFDLVSLSSFENTKVEFSEDLSAQDRLRMMPSQDSSFEQLTQEWRLTSDDDSKLRWIGGLYLYLEDLEQTTAVRQRSIPTDAQTTAFNVLDQEEKDYSVYGQVDYDLQPSLTFTAGARFTANEKQADSLFAVVATPENQVPLTQFLTREFLTELTGDSPGVCPPPVGGVPCTLNFANLEQKTKDWGWNLRLTYDIDDTKLIYGGFARGFKSGGFDTRALAAFSGTADVPVKPEYLTSFETGFKSTFNNRLRLNAALFHYWWKDLQTFDSSNFVPQFVNIPEVLLYGAELELTWQVTDTILTQLGYGHLQSEITDASGLDNAEEGHELKNTPENSVTLLIEKTFPLENGHVLLRTDYRYLSDQLDSLSSEEDPYTYKASQHYINFYSEYYIEPYSMSVALWGKNLTEEKTCHQILVMTLPGTVEAQDRNTVVGCNPNDGIRQFGVSVNYEF